MDEAARVDDALALKLLDVVQVLVRLHVYAQVALCRC